MIISGKVIDSKTNIGLYSAAVYFNAEDGNSYGSMTDIDGKFTIDSTFTPKQLIVNLIGYDEAKIDYTKFKNGDSIPLVQKDYELSTVVISAPRPQNIVYTDKPKKNWKKIGIYSGVGILSALALFLIFRTNSTK
jgi:hypothetical protein